eukprot:SAG11_NODE_20517_length_443_cov_3.220930_1_plen_73_part_10
MVGAARAAAAAGATLGASPTAGDAEPRTPSSNRADAEPPAPAGVGKVLPSFSSWQPGCTVRDDGATGDAASPL